MSDIIGQKFILDGEVKPISSWNEKVLKEPSVIYEVIRVEEGVPLFFDDYFERLTNSFRLINRSFSYSSDDLKSMIKKLLEINGCNNGPVKLLFGIRVNTFSLVYLMQPHVPKMSEYISGLHTILIRKERLNPNAKVWNQQMREATNLELNKANAYEGILVDQDGYITEGSRSNIFFIKNGIVNTTPGDFVLPGITRKKVLQLCKSNKIEVEMKRIHYSEISTYDAVFITGTSRKVLPIKSIDKIRFSVKNKTMLKISKAFENFVEEYILKVKNS